MWMRLSDSDVIDQSRGEIRTGIVRRRANPFAQCPTADGAIVGARAVHVQRLPRVSPHIDRLRLIKSGREIEILRYNGRISAEAMVRAIRAAAPGKFDASSKPRPRLGWSNTASRPPPTRRSSAPDQWAISGITRTTGAR